MLALVPWAPVAVAMSMGDPAGEPTTQPCESGLFGCWDTSVASTLRPALAYVIPCSAIAAAIALVAFAVGLARWWALAVLVAVAGSTVVYLAVLA